MFVYFTADWCVSCKVNEKTSIERPQVADAFARANVATLVGDWTNADPAIGRGTGVALGKNIGRKFYVEIITDGRGYSATSVEFRITSWLSLLGTVSTIGRDSLVAQARKDY